MLLFSGLKILLIFCCSLGLLLLASEPFALELGGGCFLTGVLFLVGCFLTALFGVGVAPFFGGFDLTRGCAFCFFLSSSFLRSSFLGAESELEFVLDTLVLFTFLWLVGFFADA